MMYSIRLLLLLSACATASGNDDKASKKALAIINRSVSALGGKATLASARSLYVRMKLTIKGRVWSHEMWSDQGVREKLATTRDENGMKIEMIRVVNGSKGWQRINGELRVLAEEETERGLESHYQYVARLLFPLLDDPQTVVEYIGETLYGERPVLHVRAKAQGLPPLELYFDKTTNLVAKYEIRPTEGKIRGKLFQQVFVEYKEFDGMKYAVKSRINIDGDLFAEEDIVEFKRVKSFDEETFAMP